MIINPYRFAAAGSNIKDNLVAWYDLEEASGTRSDAHTNGLDLTVNGSGIGSATGKVGDAVSKTSTSSEGLYHADDTLFDITGDMTIAGWVNFSSATDNFALFGKWLGTGNQRSYLLYKPNTLTTMKLLVSSNGSTTALSLESGSLSLSTWYFVTVKFVAGGTSTLYIDGSSVDSGTAPSSIYSGSARAELFSFNTGTIDTREGLIDSLGIWDRALETSEIATLYNSGSGVAYSDL